LHPTCRKDATWCRILSTNAEPKRPVNELVADASAIIALLMGEPFRHFDPADLNGASVSAVNVAEVLTRLHDLGVPAATADASIAELNLRVVPFDDMQARAAARLRATTRRAGLSLGDRACLARGAKLGCAVVTADRAWASLDVAVEVILIR
jgi:PIN domain nuclease of toxin-antitoxin system